jgi:2-methylcitrate dehydratase PrpD
MSTKIIANFVSELKFDNLPTEVILQAKRTIRDVIGVMIASHNDKAVKAARQLAKDRNGKKEATLIGAGDKVPCEMAAFVNSVLATTLDMDDGSMGLKEHTRFHRGHPGGMIIPSALAIAEKENRSGKEFIEAVIAGYEVSLTTAWLIGESVLAGRTGTYGVASAAAKLLGFSSEDTFHTLCIAEAHCPWPSYSFVWQQTHMTKEAAGWAAMTGVMAALLAETGFRGSPTLFDLPNINKIPFETIGKEWEILGIYFKPYSSCRVGHAAIDGVLEILRWNGLQGDQVSKVTIGCSKQKSLNMGNYRPKNIWQAQYSIPFTIGCILAEGEVGPEQINEKRLSDPTILQNADKVILIQDPEVEDLLPKQFAAKVEVETRDRRKFSTFIQYPKGEPENPMSEEELIYKFRRLTKKMISHEKIEELIMIIESIEKLDKINELIEKIGHF